MFRKIILRKLTERPEISDQVQIKKITTQMSLLSHLAGIDMMLLLPY